MGRIKIYMERGCNPEATEILGDVKHEGISMVQVQYSACRLMHCSGLILFLKMPPMSWAVTCVLLTMMYQPITFDA